MRRGAASTLGGRSTDPEAPGSLSNAAWLGCAVLAHNLIRWTARLGDVHPAEQLTVARTIRTRLLAIPGRLVNHSRRWTLRLPARWPWATSFNIALDRIRSLPLQA
jgi:Transposase DDE domain group 1